MSSALPEELIDSVYRVVLEPAAWGDVMELMAKCFPSSARAFYYLHRDPRRIEPVCLDGVGPRWLQSFDALYFSPDNPWIRLTQRLHRPGIVRTNERLDRVLRQRDALLRSEYYNDWMRPQRFKSTLGNTLIAEGDLVGNITLFRPPDMPTFSDAEVRAFEALSRHMTRAMRMGIRLDRPENVPSIAAALDALSHPVALIDAQRRLRYANATMESLLRRRAGLALHAGELVTTCAESQPALVAWMDRVASRAGDRDDADVAPLTVRAGDGRRVALNVVPVAGGPARAPASTRAYLLTATPAAPESTPGLPEMWKRFGCTRAEANLAGLLVEGHDLRSAAAAAGIGYGTARGYLKSVFGKTGVHTQAQLVALVLREGRARREPS